MFRWYSTMQRDESTFWKSCLQLSKDYQSWIKENKEKTTEYNNAISIIQKRPEEKNTTFLILSIHMEMLMRDVSELCHSHGRAVGPHQPQKTSSSLLLPLSQNPFSVPSACPHIDDTHITNTSSILVRKQLSILSKTSASNIIPTQSLFQVCTRNVKELLRQVYRGTRKRK